MTSDLVAIAYVVQLWHFEYVVGIFNGKGARSIYYILFEAFDARHCLLKRPRHRTVRHSPISDFLGIRDRSSEISPYSVPLVPELIVCSFWYTYYIAVSLSNSQEVVQMVFPVSSDSLMRSR